jgi:hypothetical protein
MYGMPVRLVWAHSWQFGCRNLRRWCDADAPVAPSRHQPNAPESRTLQRADAQPSPSRGWMLAHPAAPSVTGLCRAGSPAVAPVRLLESAVAGSRTGLVPSSAADSGGAEGAWELSQLTCTPPRLALRVSGCKSLRHICGEYELASGRCVAAHRCGAPRILGGSGGSRGSGGGVTVPAPVPGPLLLRSVGSSAARQRRRHGAVVGPPWHAKGCLCQAVSSSLRKLRRPRPTLQVALRHVDVQAGVH